MQLSPGMLKLSYLELKNYFIPVSFHVINIEDYFASSVTEQGMKVTLVAESDLNIADKSERRDNVI